MVYFSNLLNCPLLDYIITALWIKRHALFKHLLPVSALLLLVINFLHLTLRSLKF